MARTRNTYTRPKEVSTKSSIIDTLHKYVRQDREQLRKLLFYIQYQVPKEMYYSSSDKGYRTFVYPIRTQYLPSVTILTYPTMDLSIYPKAPLRFFSEFIQPQITEIDTTIITFESMYKQQQKAGDDYGKIIFSRQLTTLDVVTKLNYKPYSFPELDLFYIDYICPTCGSVDHANTYVRKGYCQFCNVMLE